MWRDVDIKTMVEPVELLLRVHKFIAYRFCTNQLLLAFVGVAQNHHKYTAKAA